MSALNVRKLCVTRDGLPVIDALDLPPIRAGELTVLAGPNAAGKSTLLRAIAQLLPYRGEVSLIGRDLHRTSPAERAELIGFMPQHSATRSDLSVLESLVVALHAGGGLAGRVVGGQSAEERGLAALDRVGIMDLALRALSHLSGGQMQLVALAQVIVRNTPLILLDEPTSALDMARSHRVLSIARDLAHEGRMVIAVLHDLAQASRWADQLMVLSHGRLATSGPPNEVLRPDLLANVWDVSARVERCTHGNLMVLVDDEAGGR
ncbi:ABC transporter ATP-binding protein [Paracoccus sp. MBLB3053]|uniref:ABC transporter ATP-binding protein n=1 Tax=Paracoccus aurantius TaxID=3073814 RepID=A0ABU2HW62_9RHOB|nr:ABC transporter ATP-binding protein [Paracoccus sp. MBLB3053]MDS9468834.1 ABC transporter ATP-binding protein [Paracoccus sp. MBLB3053]